MQRNTPLLQSRLNSIQFIGLITVFYALFFANASAFDHFDIDTSVIYCPSSLTFGYEHALPSVTAGDTYYFVVWNTGRIYGNRVTRDCGIIDSAGILISDISGRQAKTATNGKTFLVTWIHKRPNPYTKDIYAACINESGEVFNRDIHVHANSFVNGLDLAFGDSLYLMVWLDLFGSTTADTGRILGKRISSQGRVLDNDPIQISSRIYDQIIYASQPSIVYNGNKFFVVWNHNNRIYGTTVGVDGTVANSPPIAITSETVELRTENASVAFGDTSYLVTWVGRDKGSSSYELRGTFVSVSGTVHNPEGFVINNKHLEVIYPEVSYTGENFLVTWVNRATDYGTHYALISPDGTILKEELVYEKGVATSLYDGPSVCSDGSQSLIVFHGLKKYANGFKKIFACRVNNAGDILDKPVRNISYSANCQELPAISYDGNNFMVVWNDSRGGKSNELFHSSEIFGARVDLNGNMIEQKAIPIAKGNDLRVVNPNIAFGDSSYMVIWWDWVKRMTTGSILSRSGDIQIANFPISQVYTIANPAIAFDGTNYMLAWDAGSLSHIYGTRISQNGVVLDTPSILISKESFVPQIASGETGYLVAYYKKTYESLIYCFAKRISHEGTILDTIPLEFDGCKPQVAFAGTNYLYVYLKKSADNTYNDVVGRLIPESGQPSQPFDILIPNPIVTMWEKKIIFDGVNFQVICLTDNNIFITSVSPKGIVGTTTTIPLLQPIITNSLGAAHATGKGKTLVTYATFCKDVLGKQTHIYRLKGFLHKSGNTAIENIHKNDQKSNNSIKMTFFAANKKITGTIHLLNPESIQATNARLNLSLYNSRGQLISIYSQKLNTSSPRSRFTWHCGETSDYQQSSGVVFLRVNLGQYTKTHKLAFF